MPRIRAIKPEFCADEKLSPLSALTLEQLLERRVDPTSLEIAYLAHALLGPERLDACTRPQLSPPADALWAIIRSHGPVAGAISLAEWTRKVVWAFGSRFHYRADVAAAAIAMAERVDVVTVAELAGLVPFEALAAMLGARPRRVTKRRAAWERELAAAGVDAT